MNDFHFLRPALLLLIIPFAALLAGLIYTFGSKSQWNRICSKELQPYILVEKVKRKRTLIILPFLTLSLFILALAGPSWKETPQALIKAQSGLIIALDLSPTMDAEDIKPSRLKRALYKINDLLNTRKEGQTALIVFSGDPFLVTPLTDDIETIKALLPSLDTSIMPSSGHSVSKAIAKSIDLFNQAGVSQGSIILLTSEVQRDDLDNSIKIANERGINISILGVGTNENAPITKPNGGFLTDKKGALVMAKLDNTNLSRLAKGTGGVYVSLTVDDKDIHELSSHLTAGYSSLEETRKDMQTQWHDEGYWLVLLALPFASLLFRRGVLLTALFLIPQTLQAFAWDTLWSTSDQQAEQLFHEGKYAEAKAKFQNSDWLAAASYKLGDYESAARLFQTSSSTDALFNFATTKAKQGDFKAALEVYDELLREDPENEDALYNKNLIEEYLKQQKEEEQEKKNPNKEEDQKQKQENEKNSEQNQDAQQQQSNADRKDSDKANDEPTAEAEKELQEQYKDQVDQSLEEKEVDSKEEIALKEEMDDQKEQREIDDRWLNRIPDDPGSLLRRKFLYQYKTKRQPQD